MGCFKFDFIFANFHYGKKPTTPNHPTLIFIMSNSLSCLKEAFSFSTLCTRVLSIILFFDHINVLGTFSSWGAYKMCLVHPQHRHPSRVCFCWFQLFLCAAQLVLPLTWSGDYVGMQSQVREGGNLVARPSATAWLCDLGQVPALFGSQSSLQYNEEALWIVSLIMLLCSIWRTWLE